MQTEVRNDVSYNFGHQSGVNKFKNLTERTTNFTRPLVVDNQFFDKQGMW
jgi:hypothetical protein